jgi:hypothetical protein
MSDFVPSDHVEEIVGAKRDNTLHLARAITAEQRVYLLHSVECVEEFEDLRECEFSLSLEKGIYFELWEELFDEAVVVTLGHYGELHPARRVND